MINTPHLNPLPAAFPYQQFKTRLNKSLLLDGRRTKLTSG